MNEQRLNEMKLRLGYAPAAEPPRGQEDAWALLAEVERLRRELATSSGEGVAA